MEGPAFAAENILRLPFALRPWLSQVASIVACTNRARSLCSQRTSGVGVLGSDTAALPRGQASFPQASRCGLCGEQWGGSGDQAIREVQRRPPSLCRMAGSRGPTVHTLGLPMLPGPPGHLEMREKQQHSIQRPPPPHPRPEHSGLLPHSVILPSAWAARPSPGGGRTGSSALAQAEFHLVSTVRPSPNQALQGFCDTLRVGPSNCGNKPCPSRIFSAVFCTRGLSLRPSVFSSKPRLSAACSRAWGMAHEPAPGARCRVALAPPSAMFWMPWEWPAGRLFQAATVTAG